MLTDVQQIQQKILPHYLPESQLACAALTVVPLGNGHINQTWLVRTMQQAFVLQQINTQVFPAPWAVVENADLIARHLQQQQQVGSYALQITTPVRTLDNALAVDDAELGFWRAISCISDSHSIEQMRNPEQARQTAFAFGSFAAAMAEFDAKQLQETIGDFRNLAARMRLLTQQIQRDSHHRVADCQQWLDFAFSQQHVLAEVAEIEAKLPLRTCHNDTKINNLLFDTRQQPRAVVDLDTCMSGYLMYDFGDMVRSCCASVAEDSTCLNDINLLPDYFAAISQGWLQALAPMMTHVERDSLWLGVKVVTLMLAVRFLTDYLAGDCYFRISHDGHNLERAINQFTLYQRLLEQESQLQTLICS
ncbi:aminoglycoside phosphotransferase family protein [Shewanella avicenniae]|uniref:Aminoglycoside phosphotransferase family protein n=1 Tax=Shewanella avicenniae TaxID=2814294 RepID=A0ABX7QSG7_9GAMM|nr:aminoglycoside phosphotransferase family protein [Shewanella avicenniae]QSX33940.1 aminoglycoside phosphotransferase family protein [Shewanella avicenniae]